jgi:hypothetical protein
MTKLIAAFRNFAKAHNKFQCSNQCIEFCRCRLRALGGETRKPTNGHVTVIIALHANKAHRSRSDRPVRPDAKLHCGPTA